MNNIFNNYYKLLYDWNKNNKINQNAKDELTIYAKVVENSVENKEETQEVMEENPKRNVLKVNFEEVNKNIVIYVITEEMGVCLVI